MRHVIKYNIGYQEDYILLTIQLECNKAHQLTSYEIWEIFHLTYVPYMTTVVIRSTRIILFFFEYFNRVNALFDEYINV